MVKKIAALFQVDPLSNLNFKSDSSIFLIHEAIEQGIDIWVCSPNNISFCNNCVSVKAQRVLSLSLTLSEPLRISIKDFDFFFIRQEPPFDMHYLTNCYILELHKHFNKKPFFINEPSAIKNFTEKLSPLFFSELMPKTYITSDLEEFERMLISMKVVVIKKLFNKGGDGVFKIKKGDKNASEIFKKCSSNLKESIVVQEFIKEVKYGDKRVILIEGKPKGVINRIPKKGNFKANLHLGAKANKSHLTSKEKRICKILEPMLIKSGLFFVGIDIINEKLTEINVTCPTGLVQIKQLEEKNLATHIWKRLIKIKNSILLQ
tara:strand:+ start:163 stop:1119 length:957 start_codon:yes stop_codon:yes gene_type:complete